MYIYFTWSEAFCFWVVPLAFHMYACMFVCIFMNMISWECPAELVARERIEGFTAWRNKDKIHVWANHSISIHIAWKLQIKIHVFISAISYTCIFENFRLKGHSQNMTKYFKWWGFGTMAPSKCVLFEFLSVKKTYWQSVSFHSNK